jgi:hypothetical protein
MDELAQLKSDVSLVDYALGLGYERDPAKSTKSVTFLRRDDDKIIVRRGNCGYDIYAHVPDHDREQGSIIDFIQSREGLNLGEIRKRLRAWIGKPKPEGHQNPSFSIKSKTFSDTDEPDRQKVAAVWNAATWIPDHPYLLFRQIPRSTLNDSRFAGCWRQDRKGNAVFLHHDLQGPCGYEMRNHDFKAMGERTNKGLWISRNIKTCLRLVITESPIDCLSFHALHSDATDALWPLGYASFGGGLGNRQKLLLGAFIGRSVDRGAEVIIGTDNDLAGDGYAETLSALSPVALERLLPVGKDWNDDLCWCAKENGL